MWFWIVLALIEGVAVGFLAMLLSKATTRLLEFDDLFQLFVHDIQTNVKYMNKLQQTPLLSNAPEIIEMHRNMGIIARRLNEFAMQMTEMTEGEVEEVQEQAAAEIEKERTSV